MIIKTGSTKDFVIKNGVLVGYKGSEEHVIIPGTVTSIGSAVFRRRFSLISVTIPDTVKHIGDSAFQGCEKLSCVVLPDSDITFGESVFNGCASLADDRGFVIVGGVLFDYYGEARSVDIPDGVTRIGEKCFFMQNALTEVTLPPGVTHIGKNAFGCCTVLKKINIPDSVEYISDSAFENCIGMADSNGFVIIRGILFAYCGDRADVIIPEQVTCIGDSAFSTATHITSVYIPDSVTVIGDSAFAWCAELNTVYLPDSVTRLKEWAFLGCGKLKSLRIPPSLTSIGNMLLCATGIRELVLPRNIPCFQGSVYEVVWNSLYRTEFSSTMMTSFIKCAPESVIADPIVRGRLRINKQLIINRAVELGDAELLGKVFGIYRRFSIEEIDGYIENSFHTPDCMAFLLDYKNSRFSSAVQEGAKNRRMEKELGTRKLSVADCRKQFCYKKTEDGITITSYKGDSTEVIIPSSIGNTKVTAIGDAAFSPTRNKIDSKQRMLRHRLRSVIIPETVTTIGKKAFSLCESLCDLVVPDSVRDIDSTAFDACVLLSDSNGFMIVKDVLYFYCGSDSRVDIPDTITNIASEAFCRIRPIKEVTIPYSVTVIEDLAFAFCENLERVYLPDSVIHIGQKVFYGCPKLEIVRY